MARQFRKEPPSSSRKLSMICSGVKDVRWEYQVSVLCFGKEDSMTMLSVSPSGLIRMP